jgi:hypothetical protein
MATGGQIVFTRLVAFAIALVTAWWWRSEGHEWPVTIVVGIGGYVLAKIVIAVLIGLCQGVVLRKKLFRE